MSDLHRTVFEHFQQGMDRGASVQGLRLELEDHWPGHLAVCPKCRMDIELHQRLRAEAALRWSPTLEPQRPAAQTLAAMQAGLARQTRRSRVLEPLRLAGWVTLVALLALGTYWAIATLRPQPAVTPSPTEAPVVLPLPDAATPTPEAGEGEAGPPKTPLEPFATGAGVLGNGLWSPESRWFFFDLLEAGEDPRSDRRMTSGNFLDLQSGDICRTGQSFLGPVALSNLARWLLDGRLLLVSEDAGVQVWTPCGEVQALDDRFSEPILTMVSPVLNQGRLALLKGESRYWLLDPVTLDARSLDALLPSPEDRLAWSPSGEQLAVYQPTPGDPAVPGSLSLLDAASGDVVRSLEFPSGEMALLDWLLEDKLFMWAFGEAGPLLVDLAGDEPQVTVVLRELFGLSLVYPDEFSASSAVADSTTGVYHIAFKINTETDKATYIYHSESGLVERLPLEGTTFLIYPDGDFEPLFLAEDEPTFNDEFDLVWVDDPARGIQHLSVAGHTPRNYPYLWPRLLPDRSQIAFASSQGVSLVSLEDGRLLNFWSLADGSEPNLPLVSPDGRSLVVTAWVQGAQPPDPGGFFYLILLGP